MSFNTKRFAPLLSVLVLFFGMVVLLSVTWLPTQSVAEAASQEVEVQTKAQTKSERPVTQAAPRKQVATNTNVIISDTTPAYGFDNVATIIYLNGSGFEAPLSVQLGTEPLEITYSDSELIGAIVPAGLDAGLYDVTVNARKGSVTGTNAFGSATDEKAYEVLHAADVNDLLSSEDWLWTNPDPLRVGYAQSSVGLLVQHLGGRYSTDEVEVEFWLDQPDPITDILLGSGWTNILAPFALESTSPVIWEPQEAGEYTVCAVIDPNNLVEESNEENNTVCRTLTVLPLGLDVIPPEIEPSGFVISDDAVTTPQVTVTLDVMTATDLPNPGASGLNAIKYIEFEYILAAHRWVPVQRSPWVTYTAAYEDYPWKLVQTFGMRFMQAWISDNAGNISTRPGTDAIGLLPSEQPGFVAKHGVTFYRILLEEGESFTARLTPVDGDPDLYVWGANGQLWYDQPQTGIEEVTFEAPTYGTYQIEIHGFTDADYLLEFNPTTRRVTPSFVDDPLYQASSDRVIPSSPAVPLNDWPQFYNVEAPPINLGSTLYLPITIGQ